MRANRLKKYIPVILIILFITLCFNLCSEDIEHNLKFESEGTFLFLPTADHDTLVVNIEFAETDSEMMQGLMYRDKMDWMQGMLFVYKDVRPMSFWMKNTHLPLDLIFVSEEGVVLDFYEYATPFSEESIFSEYLSKFALEVNAGFCEENLITIGDSIKWEKFLK